MRRMAILVISSILATILLFSNYAESEFPLKGKIAFNAFLNGRWDLWVIKADGIDFRLLRKGAYAPSWSPDGRRIAYTKTPEGEIRIINANGLGDVHLTGGWDERLSASLPAWSPNGKWIVYWEREFVLPKDILSLVRIRPDGSQKEKLFVADEEKRVIHDRPSWAPDSRKVVIALGPEVRPLPSALYILDVESKTLRQLIDLNQRVYSPAWSPDGKYIAFLREWRQLHILDVQTGEIRQLTNANESASSPVWSPDGKIVGFSREDKFFGIRLQDNKEEPILSHALRDLKDMPLYSFSWVDPELFSVNLQEKLPISWGKVKSKY